MVKNGFRPTRRSEPHDVAAPHPRDYVADPLPQAGEEDWSAATIAVRGFAQIVVAVALGSDAAIMSDPSSEPPPRRWSSDRIVTLCALLMSFCGLVVSVVQTRAVLQQQRAAMWPHLDYTYSNVPDFRVTISNTGTGPAIIVSADFVWNNHHFEDLGDLIVALVSQADPDRTKLRDRSSINSWLIGRTLRPGDETSPSTWHIKDEELEWLTDVYTNAEVRHSIVYRSVYDDCWLLDDEGTRQLDACPPSNR